MLLSFQPDSPDINSTKEEDIFKVSISIDILKCSVVYLLVHLCSCPLLEKPDLQTHLYDPLVLTHTEISASHWWFLVSHSSMSANQELMLNYQRALFDFCVNSIQWGQIYIYIDIQLDVNRRSQDSALLAVKERNRPVGELLKSWVHGCLIQACFEGHRKGDPLFS